jgi:hypothetical protein
VEILGILFLIGLVLAAKAGWDATVRDFQKSKAKRIKEAAAKAAPDPLPKSRRRAAARRHAAGYWAGEMAHGFPVARTGFHAGWLAHRTATDHHRNIREEAKTTQLETRASFLAGIKDHRKRQAEAQKAINEAIAAAPEPVRGKKAVQEAAKDAVILPFPRKAAEPALPADGVDGRPSGRRPWEDEQEVLIAAANDEFAREMDDQSVIDTPVRVHNAEDSAWLRPGEQRCEGCGGSGRNETGTAQCPVCNGWGSAPPDPDAPEAAPGTICAACGRPDRPGDPVLADSAGPLHRSHVLDHQASYNEALDRLRGAPTPCKACGHPGIPGARTCCTADDPRDDPSPATNGAPVATAEITYDQTIREADGIIAECDQEIARLKARRLGQKVEMLAAAGLDPGSLSRAMDIDDALKRQEQAAQQALDNAQALKNGLVHDHGALNEAHQNAPVEAADKTFYGG